MSDIIAEVVVDDAPLDTTETQELRRCEDVIARGERTFVEVGEALAQIRDQRLYRVTHTNFADYLRERWPFIGNRRNADRMIGAAEVEANLRPIGLSIANEAQARELAPLPAEEQRTVMQEAAKRAPEGKAPTAKEIRQVAQERKAPPTPAQPARPAPPPGAPAALPPPLAIAAPTESAAEPAALPSLASQVAVQVDLAARKALAAKVVLLEGALHLAKTAYAAGDDGPLISIPGEQAMQAARGFVENPSLNSAAAFLAFSAVVEEDAG